MPAWPGFIGSSNSSASPLADCERTVNFYFEPSDLQSGRPALYPTPGQQVYIAAAGAGIVDVGTRALFNMNSRALGVIGAGVYSLASDQTATKYGSVAQDSNPAQITLNGVAGNQALIASGGNAYSLNLTTDVVSAAVLTGEATQIGMLDGYGIAFNKTIGKIRISALNDFTTWDPTQFALRSSAPDNWQAMLVASPNIWLIGEQSGDLWYDAGTAPFPLAPRPGLSFNYGITATFSLAAAGDSVLWLAKNKDGDGLLVRARGTNPQPVGSYAFNTAVRGYKRTSKIDDAEALTFQFGGHVWYVLKFPSANATWVYDLTTGAMFELLTWNANANRYDAWHPRAICAAFGKLLVGESSTGAINELDDAFGTEANGDPIRRLRIPPALAAGDGGRLFVDRFALQVEPGLGTATGQGSDPVAMLRWSKTYGKTWSSQLSRSVGKQGEYGKRVYWLRCGSSLNSMVPECVVSDPIPYRIVGADVIARGVGGQ